MTRKSQINIVLQNAAPELKKRLRLESLKQGRSTSEIGLEILNTNLPLYEDFIESETKQEVNGKQTPLNGGTPIQSTLLTR